MLTSSGFKVEKTTFYGLFDKETVGKIFNSLRITYTPKIGKPVLTKLYSVDAIYVYLPRTFTQLISKYIEIKCTYIDLHTIAPYQLIATLVPNQILAVNKIVDELTSRPVYLASVCLNMKAGLGKTFVAAGVIAKLSKRTLYIVPKKPLAVQARDDMIGCFGHNLMIGLYSKKQNHLNNVITIIVINSALKQPKEFFDSYALCVMDEVHMYCSEKRRIIFKKTCLPYVLGMSATTNNRKDLLDPCFQKEVACGGIIHADKLPGWEHADVVFNTQVDICQYYGPDEYTRTLKHESTDIIFTPYMHKQFIQDPYRIRFAVDEIRKLYNEGHNLYVFAEERDMLDTLRQNLIQFDDAIAIEEDTGKFVGGINNAVIKDVSTKRVILTTYAYSSTGVSIDKQTAIVFLTSRRANMLQILARILRRGGDQTIQRRIIDIVDVRTPLRWQLTDRQIAYDYYDMTCKTRNINYNNITI